MAQSACIALFLAMLKRLPNISVPALVLFVLATFISQPQTCTAQKTWSLQQCLDHAFEHNIQIKLGQLGEVSAEIGTQSAVGAFLPNLNANLSHGYNFGRTIDPFTNQFVESSAIRSNSFGVSTGLVLFNGFQNQLNLQRAKLAQQSALSSREIAENNVVLTIAAAYLNVLFQEEFVRVAVINREATARQVERMQSLVQAGAAAAFDLFDVEAQLASDEATIVSTQNALSLSKLNLVQLLQLPASETDTFQVVRPSDEDLERNNLPSSPEAAVGHALASFPEIVQAQYQVEDAGIGLNLAKSGRYPRIFASYNVGTGYSGASRSIDGTPTTEDFVLGSLVVDDSTAYDLVAQQEVYQFITTPFGDQVNQNYNQSVFFSMSLPLFNNFGVKSSVEQAEVNVLRSQYQLEQVRQTLTANIESAWADARAASQNTVAQESALVASERAFSNTEQRYEAGAATAIDYADARTRLDNARVSALRSKYDLAFKSRILDFYMGKPLTFR
ncbi:TolC family protein [Flavobacteriales bacterium]|nr:TolC family protein [Flavobacteriales bacterium]